MRRCAPRPAGKVGFAMVLKTPTRRLAVSVALALALLAAVAVVMPLIGSTSIDYAAALRGESPHAEILFGARVPRVLMAMVAGCGLALAGVLFQSLVRDALADPYTLGVSSGASLGAVVAICLGWRHAGQLHAVTASAFAGASLVLLLVLAIAARGPRLSSFTLLLSGITINSISMALILFLHNIADFSQSFAISRWLMGGIEEADYASLAAVAVLVVAVSLYVFAHARDWNLLAVGEDWALARGVSVNRIMFTGFLAGSLVTGAVTAMTGPIAFVGLMVPHAVRLVTGADHRFVIPVSCLIGAAFLAICDTVARTVLAPAQIPVGVITALLGGPFFIWLLRSRRKSLWM